MKTAVQIMHSELIESAAIDLQTIQLLTPFLLRALEKEKRQIIEAAKHGSNFDKSPYSNAEDYYSKTFNDEPK